MSHKRPIHVLIVEDDAVSQDGYTEIFNSLRRKQGIEAVIHSAASASAAETELESERAFELVLLDLNLPTRSNTPAPKGVDQGLTLLGSCERRDRRPIPSVLVISGFVSSTDQSEVRDRLARSFFYGRLLIKQDLRLLEVEIENATNRAFEYRDVMVDAENISPREVDLLRRAAAELGILGFHLSSPTKEQQTWSAGLPFLDTALPRLFGTAIVAGRVDATAEFVFAFVPDNEFARVWHEANDWQLKRFDGYVVCKVRSSSQSLFVMRASPSRRGSEDELVRCMENAGTGLEALSRRESEEIGARRLRVLNVIETNYSNSYNSQKIIDGLAKIDPLYAQLDTSFVRESLEKKVRSKPVSVFWVAATLTLCAGALGEGKSPGVKVESKRRTNLSNLFRETRSKKKKRAGS